MESGVPEVSQAYFVGILTCVLIGLGLACHGIVLVIVLCAVLGVVALDLWRPHGCWPASRAWGWTYGLLWCLLLASWLDDSLLYDRTFWWGGWFMRCLAIPLLVSYRWSLSPGLQRIRFALWCLLVLGAGVDTLRVSPHPAIDVWSMQTLGAQEFLAGRNPYQTVSTPDTGPPVPGQVGIPYLYPPTQLALTSLAYALWGDVRFAMLAAQGVTGLVLRRLARAEGDPSGLWRDAPTLALWLSPRLFFVLEQAWTEPVCLALVSLAVLVGGRGFYVLLGLAGSAKQTGFWLLPLAWRLVRGGWGLRLLGLLAFLGPLAPFAAWDFRAFKLGMLDHLARQPLRYDSLTLINAYNLVFDTHYGGALGFVLAALVLVLAPRWGQGCVSFCRSAVVLYLAFFLFNRQAFLNYYFLVSGLAALSAAADRRGELPCP